MAEGRCRSRLERAFATGIKTAKVQLNCQIARLIIDTILGRRRLDAKPVKTTVAAHAGYLLRQDSWVLQVSQPSEMAGRSSRGPSTRMHAPIVNNNRFGHAIYDHFYRHEDDRTAAAPTCRYT